MAMVEGSCHCGAVRFSLAMAPQSVTDCNCSVCRRLGTLWAYCNPGEVTFTSGGDATATYRPGDSIDFHHCPACGCTTHWSPIDSGHPRMGVNARLLAPAVLAATRVRHIDGADTWEYLDD
jgi:hypothetical protein